jgi:N-acyl-D-aspartate/D-glutamate deacylase
MLGVHDRGIIADGFAADLVIFDPEKVDDVATFAEPHQYPKGIKYVIVNGGIAARDNEISPQRNGKMLRSMQKDLAKIL